MKKDKNNIPTDVTWSAYDKKNRPNTYGKYLTKDNKGNIKWSKWNNTGWGYSNDEIREWSR